MKLCHRVVLGISCSLLKLTFPVATASSSTSAPTSSISPDAASEAGVVALLIVGSLLALGIVVRWHDLKRMRDNEAVGLQGRITDVLLADRLLSGMALTPLVRMPNRRDGLVSVAVSGWVPTTEVRDAVMDLVMRTMETSRTSFRVEDRIVVDPLMDRRAA